MDLGDLGFWEGESASSRPPIAMVLDRDAVAAHRAELTATHSRKGVSFSLLANDIAKLLTFFTDNDMDVDCVHYDVDRSNEESWQAEWLEYAQRTQV